MRNLFQNMWPTSKNIFANAFLLVVVFFCVVLPVQAQSLGGYAIDTFHETINVTSDGKAHVVETLMGNFFEPRHGLYRNIPDRTHDGVFLRRGLGLTDIEVTYQGKEAPFALSRQNDYRVIRVGDPEVLVDGPFEYTFSYTAERPILFGETEDVFYWNITGTDWEGIQFNEVQARVHIDGFAISPSFATCYTGAFGSEDQYCQITEDGDDILVQAADFVTVRLVLPKGVIHPPTTQQILWWFLRDNVALVSLLCIPLVAGAVFIYWLFVGRDPRLSKTVIAQYDPPTDLLAIEVGMLRSTRLRPAYFGALLVDLAVKGFLTIRERKGSFLKKTSYTLVATEKPRGSLPPVYAHALEILFLGTKEVEVSSSEGPRFQNMRTKAETDVFESLAQKKFYEKNVTHVRRRLGVVALVFIILVGIGAFMLSSHTQSFLPFISAGGSIACVLLGVHLAPRRTLLGAERLWEAEGFKLFLEKAERYRIHWQEREHIFETFLPYAMVFGVSKKWAQAFTSIPMEHPSWYEGNLTTFSAVSFANTMQSFAVSAGTVKTPSSSSSGGGSSGGGFGGGGGGSW